jgi:hypothetical protein
MTPPKCVRCGKPCIRRIAEQLPEWRKRRFCSRECHLASLRLPKPEVAHARV